MILFKKKKKVEKDRKTNLVLPFISPGRIARLRFGDPSQEELEKFFKDRDHYYEIARRLNIRIPDFFDFSPMYLKREWMLDDEGNMLRRGKRSR